VRVAVPKFAFTPEPGPQAASAPAASKTAQIYLAEDRPLAVPAYDRAALRPGQAITGPAIVRQLDATTLLPPGWTALVDAYRNLILGAPR
jgi:N-methylhydantoinase A